MNKFNIGDYVNINLSYDNSLIKPSNFTGKVAARETFENKTKYIIYINPNDAEFLMYPTGHTIITSDMPKYWPNIDYDLDLYKKETFRWWVDENDISLISGASSSNRGSDDDRGGLKFL
jgi:hypothetical protein